MSDISCVSGSKRTFPNAAGVERRVHPRHFHAGPNRSVGALCTDKSDAVNGHSPNPVTRLYRHALESIFRFVTKDDMVSVLRVSHCWLAAVKSMANMMLQMHPPNAPLWVVATSTLGRHTTILGSAGNRLKLTSDTLFILTRHMSHLRGLSCELSLPPSQAMLTFPSALRELSITIPSTVDAEDVNVALTSVGCHQSFESFDVRLHVVDPQISFASLTTLPRLRCLRISWCLDQFSNAQVDELRLMTQLDNMVLTSINADRLRLLLRQPHNLQWQQIQLRSVDDESAALLPQLPSLTKLDHWFSCTNFDWLQRLPNLTDLDIGFRGPTVAGRIESLVAALPACTAITNLALREALDLTSDHLKQMLPRLLQLKKLWLFDLRITSLAFLAQEPMKSQLMLLDLDGCKDVPLTELRHVHSLHKLQKLFLIQSFTTTMDAHCQSFYTPPSIVLPQLKSFIFTAH